MTAIPILFCRGRGHKPPDDDDPGGVILAVMIAVLLICCLGGLGYVVWHEVTT